MQKARIARARGFRKASPHSYAVVRCEEAVAWGAAAGANGVALLTALRIYANKSGIAYPSKYSLARASGMSERTVVRTVRQLEEQGLLRSVRNGRRATNTYLLSAKGLKSFVEQNRIAIARKSERGCQVGKSSEATRGDAPKGAPQGCPPDTRTNQANRPVVVQVGEDSPLVNETFASAAAISQAEKVEMIAATFEARMLRRGEPAAESA